MNSRSTRASEDLSHLSVEQIVGRGRGRGAGSRSPSPAPTSHREFFPNHNNPYREQQSQNTNMLDIPAEATADELRAIAIQAHQEAQTTRSQQDRLTAALEAATQAAASATAALQALGLATANNSAASSNRRKKPDLPVFDKNNIQIWIKRVEAAYARENVTDPKQKFAFLESVIGVNMGPTVNAFMFGEATQTRWDAFLQHLISTYGPTKQMRCSTYLDGVKRDGRRPSDLLALIRDKGKDVTIDDLEKQLVIRALPPDVQKLIQDKVEPLDATQTAALADTHFDQQGRPLNQATQINAVANNNRSDTCGAAERPNNSHLDEPVQYTAPFSAQPDAEGDVNHINQRRGRPAPRGSSNRGSNNNPRFTPSSSGSNSRTRSTSRPASNQRRSFSNNRAATPTSGGSNEMSSCRFHSSQPNSRECMGPNCPQHSSASSCRAKSCQTHAAAGNGMGGRR